MKKRIIYILIIFITINISLIPKIFIYTKDFISNNISLKNNDILASISIPSINLNKDIYKYNSYLNNVNTNIELISNNCLPTDNCNFILASHSGNSSIAHFKNLDKLKTNDIAIINYKNNNYKYELSNIEIVDKNGSITIPKVNISTLILTTCNKLDDTKQNIYYFKKMNT